jgi:hypothetical protein
MTLEIIMLSLAMFILAIVTMLSSVEWVDTLQAKLTKRSTPDEPNQP